MKQTKFAKALALSTGVLILSLSASYLIFALPWAPPTAPPPDGNVDAPINTGSGAQTKTGALTTGGLTTTGSGVLGGYLTIANSEKTDPGEANQWKIYNMTGTYGNSLQFWAYDTVGCSGGLCNSIMTITDTGNVGLGTSLPASKLDIVDNGTGAGTQFLRIGDDTFLTDIDMANTLGIYGLQDSTASVLKLGSAGGTIAGYNGNIGIGTASPTQKLDVRGHITTNGIMELTQHGTGNRYSFIDFHGDDTYTDYSFRIIRDNSGPNAESRIEHHGTGRLRLQTDDPGSNIVMNPVTNVGIGTENPTKKLEVAGYVKARDGLCIGDSCCSSWAECASGGSNPFMPASGCTSPLLDPTNNKKIFVTSITYDVALVHAANFTYTMANADNLCQARASAAGLPGTYLALMYETVLSELNNCNKITILRYPTDVLPGAALWNGEKISGENICEWHLVATGANDMLSVNPDGNYLQNPIEYNEFGTLTDARVFTNFQPTGNGAYDRMNTCLQYSTCDYITGGAIRGCFYGYSRSKDVNWAGASSPRDAMDNCVSPCMNAGSQKALYCVQQ